MINHLFIWLRDILAWAEFDVAALDRLERSDDSTAARE